MADPKLPAKTAEVAAAVDEAAPILSQLATLAAQIALIVAHLNHASLSESVKAV